MREVTPSPFPAKLGAATPAPSLRARAVLALLLTLVAAGTWNRAHQARTSLSEDTQRLRSALQGADDAQARKLARAAIPLAPEDPHLAALVMDTLARLDLSAEAVDVGRRALSGFPEAHGLRLRLGLALAAEGHTEGAAGEFRQVLRVLPASARAHQELGKIAHRSGDLAQACHHYRKALRVKPADPELHTMLGSAQAALKDFEGAESSFHRAVELAPNDPEAATNLGMLLLRRNQRDEARAWFTRAQELAPEHARAGEGLAELAQLKADGL